MYTALKKGGIITPEGDIDTRKIDKRFASLLYFVSQFVHRRVVGVLFFWEEEAGRLSQIGEMEREVRRALEVLDERHLRGGDGGFSEELRELGEEGEEGETGRLREELRVRLRQVEMERGLRPSMRAAGEHGYGMGAQGEEEELPRYG